MEDWNVIVSSMMDWGDTVGGFSVSSEMGGFSMLYFGGIDWNSYLVIIEW